MIWPTTSVEASAVALPRSCSWASDFVLATLFAALMALGAQIAIPLPYTPVPITLQVLFVLLAGGLLGARAGTVSQLEYLLMGTFGLRVFAGGTGAQIWLGARGGYLIGFVAAAYVIGRILEATRWQTRWIPIALGGGIITIYLFGAAWLAGWYALARHVSFADALTRAVAAGVVPFIAVDLVKLLVAVPAVSAAAFWSRKER